MVIFLKRSLLLACLFLGFSIAVGLSVCNAQNYDPPQRIEIEIEQDKPTYHLRLMGGNGFVLISRNDQKEIGKWTITHYDTNLTQLLTKDISLEIHLVLSDVNSDKENFYAILQSPAIGKVNVVNTYIINYNVVTKKIDVFSLYQAERAVINHITLLGNIFVFTSYNSKAEECIYSFNNKSLVTEKLYENKTAPFEFQQAYIDTIDNSLWLITKFYESKRQTIFTLTQLNEDGKIVQERDIVMDENYYLNSCRITRMDKDRLMLIGDYTLLNKENLFTTRNNNAGMFSVSIVKNEIQNISYLEYGTLEGLSGTANKKNTSDLYSNTYIVAQTDSIVIVISDFYTPEYVHEVYSNRNMNYGIWGGNSAYLPSEAKLVGFKYHLAYFFIYDKSGNMTWYNVFNYNGLMLKSVKRLVHAYIEETTYNTLYYFAFEGKLYSLINNKNKIIQPITIENIDPSSRFFSVNANTVYNCEHWYGDYFVYYGYQKMYNRYSKDKSKKNNKHVFYVNKLMYR